MQLALCTCCRRFLGAGAFGEVYLARWRHAEVAVKCLSAGLLSAALPTDHDSDGSPSPFSAPSDAAAAAAATDAVMELMKEAHTLGHLRHPNVVAVWGVVLPPNLLLAEGGGKDASAGIPDQDQMQGELEEPGLGYWLLGTMGLDMGYRLLILHGSCASGAQV